MVLIGQDIGEDMWCGDSGYANGGAGWLITRQPLSETQLVCLMKLINKATVILQRTATALTNTGLQIVKFAAMCL